MFLTRRSMEWPMRTMRTTGFESKPSAHLASRRTLSDAIQRRSQATCLTTTGCSSIRSVSNSPDAGRSEPLATANESPDLKHRAALQQIDAAITVMRSFGEQHAHGDEMQCLIEPICAHHESLKSHRPPSMSA